MVSATLATLAVLVALTSCSGDGGSAATRPGSASVSAPASGSPTPSTSDTADAPATPPASATVAHVAPLERPNELGDVPVLMYHQVLKRPKGVYDITPAAFRGELERLAREGYVPVTASDYAIGQIDIPVGRHPVVLTFDDSTTSQLRLDAAGQPAAGTAVAILQAVAAKHDGFTATATFYVNRDPFAERGGKRTLAWLRAHDYEIGNHTLDHLSLSSLSPDRIRRQLAGDTRLIQRATSNGEPVTTLALPFGIRPGNRRLMMSGSWAGQHYAFEGAFLVGAGPAPSPYSRDFDPVGIPRIRSQGRKGPEAGYGSARWLDRLRADPRGRYTSDGDPDVISFPAKDRDRLKATWRSQAQPY